VPHGDASRDEPGRLLTIALPRPRTLVRGMRLDDSGPQTVLYFRDVTRELEVDRKKSEFLSVAAHELRTPMTSIYGFSELLVAGRMPAEQQTHVHDIIHRQSSALVSLVSQLLDLARINAAQGSDIVLRAASMRSVVREALVVLRGSESFERIVDAMPVDDDVMVMVDAEQFRLAVTNILSNALKYSNTGPVEIGIAVRQVAPNRWQAGLRVRDRGIGMSGEQLSRLFERFYRANPVSGASGTGLGSNIVRDIMTAHKGEVQVVSELGMGTEVTLWVDRA
jgi:signal transduction histidine kinase